VWLTTTRLGLRRFTRGDLPWLVELHSDPDVTRYLSGAASPSAAETLLQTRILEYYDEHPGLGIWVTLELATGDAIGYHVLNHIQGESIIQVGYVLSKPAWGKGYAAEMGEALVRYGFVERGLTTIAAIANRENVASQRVLMKIGLQRRGERAFAHPNYAAVGPLAWFERDAEDWLKERGGR
jgi:[ribosomal protein S5]-alanine N-acetyltransferase